MTKPIAVVTGASPGIGHATATKLALDGYHVVAAARRQERIAQLSADIDGVAVACDITSREDVDRLAETVNELDGELELLVNNAGGAFGMEQVDEADFDDWRRMYEVNVLGTAQVTQALLPALRKSGAGTIVIVSSTAGLITYEGGGGYTAAKHAETAVAETLRLELCGQPVRVVEINPGMVKTDEFSLVRNRGDATAAAKPYEGVEKPLVAEDIADCIAWAASMPHHVNIDRMVVRPLAQAAQHKVHRVT